MGFSGSQIKLIILFTMLLAISSAFITNPALATENQFSEPMPRAAFFTRHYLLTILTDFERYQSGQGNPDLAEHLTAQLKALQPHLDTLQDQQPSLQQHWQLAARALSACLVTVQQGGFIDQEVSYQYQERMLALWHTLNTLHPLTAKADIHAPMDLILLLQMANLRYLNPRWLLAPYHQKSLLEMTGYIEASIQVAAQTTPAVTDKWPLLQQAFLNESRSMEFIVNRYSSDLVSLLIQTRF